MERIRKYNIHIFSPIAMVVSIYPTGTLISQFLYQMPYIVKIADSISMVCYYIFPGNTAIKMTQLNGIMP